MDKGELVRENLSSREGIHQTWLSRYRTDASEVLIGHYFRWIVDQLGLTPDMSILDAGCGTAFNAVKLAKMGLRVDGVDFSPFAIEQARAFVEANGVADRVKVRIGDLTSLDLPDGCYDAVICFGVLMHIPDVESAIDELVRVLKPGGVLVISEANRASPEYLLNRAFWRLRPGRIAVEQHGGYTNVWLEDGDQRLLSRKFSMRWLVERFERSGMRLMWKKSGDLTELYTRFPPGMMRRLILRANAVWFRLGGSASIAIGNFVALRKLDEPQPGSPS